MTVTCVMTIGGAVLEFFGRAPAKESNSATQINANGRMSLEITGREYHDGQIGTTHAD
jgi:hypothetical protein